MKKVKILDVQFDVMTKEEVLQRIFKYLKNHTGKSLKHIVTPNPEMLLEAAYNKEFRSVLTSTWLSVPDGIGILWASTYQAVTPRGASIVLRLMYGLFTLLSIMLYPRYCRKIFPERVSGVDLMEEICSRSRSRAFRIFLLGASVGTAQLVKEILEARYPGIAIVGTLAASPHDDDFPAIQARMAEAAPDVLFVAYGAPAQEFWIRKHAHDLAHVKIAMGVGGAFDFIAGLRKRAPFWMQKTGLEWIYRLIQEPSRIKRIWNAAVKFPVTVIFSCDAHSCPLFSFPTPLQSRDARDLRSQKRDSLASK